MRQERGEKTGTGREKAETIESVLSFPHPSRRLGGGSHFNATVNTVLESKAAETVVVKN